MYFKKIFKKKIEIAKINWVCCRLDWTSLKTGSKDPVAARKTKILSSVL